MTQSAFSECITIIQKTFVKQGIPGQNKEKQNHDKNPIHMPRQCLRDGAKVLILLGFLDGNIELTPYLHLWEIGSVFKTYGNYKRYVLKNKN